MRFAFQITHTTRPEAQPVRFEVDVTPAMVADTAAFFEEPNLTARDVARMAAADEADAIVRGGSFCLLEVA